MCTFSSVASQPEPQGLVGGTSITRLSLELAGSCKKYRVCRTHNNCQIIARFMHLSPSSSRHSTDFLQLAFHFFFSLPGRAGSEGDFPIISACANSKKMESVPHVRPTTTPASTIFLHGYGRRFTAATIPATPMVTDQLVMTLFFVAWNSPIEYSGARNM